MVGKQLEIVVGTSEAVAASVLPVHSRGGRQLLTEPEGIQRVGRWPEREQDHDLSPQTQFPFAVVEACFPTVWSSSTLNPRPVTES